MAATTFDLLPLIGWMLAKVSPVRASGFASIVAFESFDPRRESASVRCIRLQWTTHCSAVSGLECAFQVADFC